MPTLGTNTTNGRSNRLPTQHCRMSLEGTRSRVVNIGRRKRLGCLAGSAFPCLHLRATGTLVLGRSIPLMACIAVLEALGRNGGGASRAGYG
jgi:hypothetical protein